MKKRILCCLLMAAMAAAGLVGCGGNTTSSSGDAKVEEKTEEKTTKQNEPVDLEITESSYTVDDEGMLRYTVCIENNNTNFRPQFAHVLATGKKPDGSIRFHDDWTIMGIQPDSTTYWTNIAGNGEVSEEDTIEITVTVNESDWERSNTVVPDDLYTFDNVNIGEREYFGTQVTGEITLTDDSLDLGSMVGPYRPMIVCILRDADGKLIGGFDGFLDTDMAVGNKSIFDFSSNHDMGEYASYELHVNPWV